MTDSQNSSGGILSASHPNGVKEGGWALGQDEGKLVFLIRRKPPHGNQTHRQAGHECDPMAPRRCECKGPFRTLDGWSFASR